MKEKLTHRKWSHTRCSFHAYLNVDYDWMMLVKIVMKNGELK